MREKKVYASQKVSLLFNNRHTLGSYRGLNQSEIVKADPPLIGRGPDIPVLVKMRVLRQSDREREVSSRDARSVTNLATFQTPLATLFSKESD